jgi:outer membrane protein OmpA-like peptidoglycan-associated protein
VHVRATWLAIALVLSFTSLAQAQGVALDQYRAADTPLDGFVVWRPRTLTHLQSSVSLHVDYGLAPLRGPASMSGAQLVDHELAGQVGAALGLFDRLVVAARLPVVLFMPGAAGANTAPMMRDPIASGPGLGDLALALRYRLVGEDADTFALALRTEATIPLAEAIAPSQDLAGESGVTFSPSLAGELRFAPVRITANVGARFRQPAIYRTLQVRQELTWALAISVDLVPEVLEAMLEGYGATPFDRFATASVSPVEAILGLRVRPIAPLFIGLAGGAGIGDAYGNPEFRGVLMLGWADVAARPTTAPTDDVAEPVTTAVALPTETVETAAPTETVATPTTEEVAVASTERVVPPGRDTYGQLDRDGDRLVDAEDQCVLDGEDYDEVEDPDGCPEEDADHDGVPDDQDACPLVPGVTSTTAEQSGCPARAYVSERGTIVITSRIEFASGSDRILRASEAVLGDVVAILSRETDVMRVRVEGHTDDRGADAANLRLSTSRAASVRRWLVAHGVAAERIEAWGCGELHPLEQGTSVRARAANRRVEFFITDPMTPGMTLRDRCVEASP